MPEGQEGHSIFFRLHVVLWWLCRFGLQGAAEFILTEVCLLAVLLAIAASFEAAAVAVAVAVAVAAATAVVACLHPPNARGVFYLYHL